MRTALPVTLLLFSIAAATAAAADEPGPASRREAPFVVVPAAGGADGTFLIATGDDGSVEATAAGDTARLVAGKAMLVLAADGSRLAIPAGRDPSADVLIVRVIEGAFRLLVGSSPVRLSVAGTDLEIRRAELILVSRKEAFALRILAVRPDGTAFVHPPPPSPSAVAGDATDEADGEIPVSAPPRRVLAPGESIVLALNAAPMRAPRVATDALAAVEAALALVPVSAAGPRLRPVAVEDPADLAFARTRGGIGDTDIEIEGVEIEVGCVEVCVD